MKNRFCKDSILCLLILILTICALHNFLFKLGLFGGSTTGFYNNIEVRILKIKQHKALIAPYKRISSIYYTTGKNEIWVNLNDDNLTFYE